MATIAASFTGGMVLGVSPWRWVGQITWDAAIDGTVMPHQPVELSVDEVIGGLTLTGATITFGQTGAGPALTLPAAGPFTAGGEWTINGHGARVVTFTIQGTTIPNGGLRMRVDSENFVARTTPGTLAVGAGARIDVGGETGGAGSGGVPHPRGGYGGRVRCLLGASGTITVDLVGAGAAGNYVDPDTGVSRTGGGGPGGNALVLSQGGSILVVAGGGGGGGVDSAPGSAIGGAGGGLVGGDPELHSATGRGGTQTVGGAGGAAAGTSVPPPPDPHPPGTADGKPGAFLQGGRGGDFNPLATGARYNGAGGGGGYYGGGGGGTYSSNSGLVGNVIGFSGGGGSSYTHGGASAVVHTQGGAELGAYAIAAWGATSNPVIDGDPDPVNCTTSVTFETPGIFEVPPDVYAIKITAEGGGGGEGVVGPASGSVGGGAPGGRGGRSITEIPVLPGQRFRVWPGGPGADGALPAPTPTGAGSNGTAATGSNSAGNGGASKGGGGGGAASEVHSDANVGAVGFVRYVVAGGGGGGGANNYAFPGPGSLGGAGGHGGGLTGTAGAPAAEGAGGGGGGGTQTAGGAGGAGAFPATTGQPGNPSSGLMRGKGGQCAAGPQVYTGGGGGGGYTGGGGGGNAGDFATNPGAGGGGGGGGGSSFVGGLYSSTSTGIQAGAGFVTICWEGDAIPSGGWTIGIPFGTAAQGWS